MLEQKHLELSRMQAIHDQEMAEQQQKIKEERATMSQEQANEQKAGVLLNNVLRLNERMVKQLQDIGKSRKPKWRPSSAQTRDVAGHMRDISPTSTHSRGKSLSRSVGPPVERSGRSVSRGRAAHNIEKRTKQSNHHLTSTKAHEDRMRAQLPRSAAQIKSVEEREVAHFDREVDRLETDFLRMKRDFKSMVSDKEPTLMLEDGDSNPLKTSTYFERVRSVISPEQIDFGSTRDRELDKLRGSSSRSRGGRTPRTDRESLRSSSPLADGFQDVLDAMHMNQEEDYEDLLHSHREIEYA